MKKRRAVWEQLTVSQSMEATGKEFFFSCSGRLVLKEREGASVQRKEIHVENKPFLLSAFVYCSACVPFFYYTRIR